MMTDSNRAAIQPTSSVAAPALRKRFYEAHRFLSRVAQFPLVLAKLYRDGLDHPQFFAALGELLPLERLCFCLWEPSTEEEVDASIWVWEEKQPPLIEQATLPGHLLQTLRSKPLRLNECSQEIDEALFQTGAPLWGDQTRSMLSLPMHYNGQFMGVLLLCAHQAARYNDGDFAHAQSIADALAPMAAHRQVVLSQSALEQTTLIELEQAQVEAAAEIESLRTQLQAAQEELQAAQEELEATKDQAAQAEQDQFASQKRLLASKQERSRLNDQLQIYRDERLVLRQHCDRFGQEAQRAIEDGEALRQVLLRTHRSISMFRQIAESRIKDSLAASQTQTELILDASSQMIPEALNSLNHLTSLQDASFGQLNSRQQRFVRFSLRSVRYISQLLSELNDYNRCLLGQLNLSPETLSLDPIFEEVRAKFHKHTKQKRLSLEWHRDPAVGTVLGDPYVTRQILYMMLEHAVDATPISGTIRFEVVPSTDDPDSYTMIVDHDSELELLLDGELDQLFVPFRRPDFDPDDDIPPGLALSLARELASLQNGDVEVAQEEQRLRFVLTLPLVLEVSDAPRESPHAYKPLLELPPLAEEWEAPFASRYELPSMPTQVPSFEQLPAVQTSQSSLRALPASRTSGHAPHPPQSLSSPSLSALTPIPESTFGSSKAVVGQADAFLDAVDHDSDPMIGSSAPDFSGGELGTPAPSTRPSHVDLLAAEGDEGAVTMLSSPSASALTPPPLPQFASMSASSPSMPAMSSSPSIPAMSSSPSIPAMSTLPVVAPSPSKPSLPSISIDDLEAELDLEENAPTQLFRVSPSRDNLRTPSIFEVDALDGEDSFVLEEIEDVKINDEHEDLDDDFVIEGLDEEPEFLSPSGNRRSVKSSLLYLTTAPASPRPSLFSLFDAWGMPLLEKSSLQILMKALVPPLPGAVALISTDPGVDQTPILRQLQGSANAQTLPLMMIHQYPEREARLKLNYAAYESDFLKESFWLGWLDRIRHPNTDAPRQVLSIGSAGDEPTSLLRFCCGEGYELNRESNPALGVQTLYQAPPDLLLIRFDDPLADWCPLLEEVGRSGRTRDIPIVFFSHSPPTPELQRAMKPLHFLFMLAR